MMLMDGEPDGEHIHAARHGNDGIIRQSKQEKPWSAKMAKPGPEFGGQEQSRERSHDSVAVIWDVDAPANRLGGGKLCDLEKIQWARGRQCSALRSVAKEKL